MNTFFDGTIEFFLTFTTTKVDRVAEDVKSLVSLYDSYLSAADTILVSLSVTIAAITVLMALFSLLVLFWGKETIEKWILTRADGAFKDERFNEAVSSAVKEELRKTKEDKEAKESKADTGRRENDTEQFDEAFLPAVEEFRKTKEKKMGTARRENDAKKD